MKKEKWVWMGHAGHFILGNKCRFRLNTYVGKYIISTVGEWIPDNEIIDAIRPEFKLLRGDKKETAYIEKYQCEDIAYNCKYETMVFKARRAKRKCCPYEIIVSKIIDTDRYNSAEEASKGHLELCKEWAKIKKGEKK